jgi:hypothetical protein
VVADVQAVGVHPDLQDGQAPGEVVVQSAVVAVVAPQPDQVVHVPRGRGAVESGDLLGDVLLQSDDGQLR